MRRLTSGFCSHASGPASKALALVVAMAATAACGDDSSTTDLNPAGPPMIRQVFMREKITVVDGETTTTRIKNAVAFGSHPNLPIDDFGEDNGTVTTAVARGDQAIRIVLDELVTRKGFTADSGERGDC